MTTFGSYKKLINETRYFLGNNLPNDDQENTEYDYTLVTLEINMFFNLSLNIL